MKKEVHHVHHESQKSLMNLTYSKKKWKIHWKG